jgi:hypothetical protein
MGNRRPLTLLFVVLFVISAVAFVVIFGGLSYLFAQPVSEAVNDGAHNTYSVPASSQYHILADGNIKLPEYMSTIPDPYPISRNGSTYKITDKIALIVEKSNIVVDGDGLPPGNPNDTTHYPTTLRLTLSNVKNVLVLNWNTHPAYSSIFFDESSNCTLFNSTFNQINFGDSKNNVLANCTVLYNIKFRDSSDNTITHCNATDFELSSSNNNRILYSQFSNPHWVLLSRSSNNLIFGNTFELCTGWMMEPYSQYSQWMQILDMSNNNLIMANNVASAKLGIGDRLTGDNTFYHNNFQNFNWTVNQASYSATTWSLNGQGNYWSNYKGIDANRDGIGDTPVIIDQNTIDNYPLMAPVNIAEEKIPNQYLEGS